MPSRSPGQHPAAVPHSIKIGRPNESLQSVISFVFRHKRYFAYISGRRLFIFSGPNVLVQAITFSHTIVAIASHASSGQLVVAQEKDVLILDILTEGWTKVWWESSTLLRRRDDDDLAMTLSWTSQGEILVGGSLSISMFSTTTSHRASIAAFVTVDSQDVEERMPLWTKSVASPVRYAAGSPSGYLIASNGNYDKLVKIWRRLSFEDATFDYAYLPHPHVVTHIEWKVSHHRHETQTDATPNSRHEDDPEVLVTVAADGLLRLWSSGTSHDKHILALYSTVDLVSGIPSSPAQSMKDGITACSPARFTFLLPADDLCDAIAEIVSTAGEQTSHAIEHLKEIASNHPDSFVIMDAGGRMSAWGVRSIGHKRRPDSSPSNDPFHVAHAEGLQLQLPASNYTDFLVWLEAGKIQCLAHTFDRHIQWWESPLEVFLSPSAPSDSRIRLRTEWSGQRDAVEGMVLSSSGQSVLTWTANAEIAVWNCKDGKDLDLISTVPRLEEINGIEILPTSDIALVFGSDNIAMLSLISGKTGHTLQYNIDWTKPSTSGVVGQHVVLIDRTGKAHLITSSDTSQSGLDVRHAGTIDFPSAYAPTFMTISVLSAGHLGSTSFCLTCIDSKGTVGRVRLHLEGSTVSQNDEWTIFETQVFDVTAFDANTSVAAIGSAKSKKMAIVDLVEGYVEHESSTENGLRLISCSQSISNANSVALMYGDSVELYAQTRYSRHRHGTAWSMEKLNFHAPRGTTFSSLQWHGRSALIVATAHGLLTTGLESNADTTQNQEIIPARPGEKNSNTSVGSALPLWHPELLECLVQFGRTVSALSIIHHLLDKIRFWSEGEPLELNPDLVSEILADDPHQSKTIVVGTSTGKDLAQQLQEKRLPQVSSHEQHHLVLIVEALVYVAAHVGGLDQCALLYLFHWKLRLLQLRQNGSDVDGQSGANTKEERFAPEMNWREITFALHSDTQQALLDILVNEYDNAITWPIARLLGITAWLRDNEALRQVFESLAQSAYRATSPADPINASLYFLALDKKSTLLGLWRIATWHREQKATLNFLKRDFTQAETRTAAKKNAYALMGKRRFEYAAAFFLLADDCPSAVSVLAGQCEDVMLAVAVARLFNKADESPALGNLIHDRLLPLATRSNDRWWMSWCYSMLSDKVQAAEALVRPLDGPKKWTQDDPVALLLYRLLRKQSSTHEYKAVLRAARVFTRMGLHPFALSLVRSWTFKYQADVSTDHAANSLENPAEHIKPAHEAEATNGHAPSILDGFMSAPSSTAQPASSPHNSTSTSAGLSDQDARQAKAAELLKKLRAKQGGAANGPVMELRPKPPPTQFQEPDPNSLLDSFGF